MDDFLSDAELGALYYNRRRDWSAFGPVLSLAELDALPVASCVIDQFGDVLQKHDDGLWHSYETRPLSSAYVVRWSPRRYDSGPS